MKIAFYGTGLMGAPMVKKLLDAGYEVNVYNRTKSKAEKLVENGAQVFDKPGEAAEESEVLVLMLADYNAVTSVLFPDGKNIVKGKPVIQMSTISTSESILLKDRVEEQGGEYMEAPVLGSIPQVEDGKLIVIFGGTEEQFGKWKELFSAFSDKVVHMGETGKGAAAKLALNQLIAALTAAFSTSLGYIREQGVNIEKFMDILRGSALYAPSFDKKLDRFMSRDFKDPHFPLKHLLKDVGLVLGELKSGGINPAPLEGVKKVIQEGLEQHLSELDYSSMYNVIHPEKKRKS